MAWCRTYARLPPEIKQAASEDARGAYETCELVLARAMSYSETRQDAPLALLSRAEGRLGALAS